MRCVCLVFHDGGGKPPEETIGGENERVFRTRRAEARGAESVVKGVADQARINTSSMYLLYVLYVAVN